MRAMGETAEALGMKAWLVGGIVRDLMLSLPLGDVDVVVEGQGIRLGHALEERLGGRFHPHEKFLTGVWVFSDGSRVDIATARRETYARPGALPEVEASALKHDLYRRDFSVNTLVVALNPGEFGKLMDHFGGLQDLKQRTIRVLHSLSFIEDPTRAFRAVRLCERLNFKLSSDTEKLIHVALKNRVFDHLSGFRLWEEVALLLDLPDAYRAMERLEGLGLLSALHPRLAFSPETQALFLSAQEVLHWAHIEGIGPEHPAVFAMLGLLRHLDDGELPAVASRFAFDGGRRALVEDHRRVARELNVNLYRAELPSQIHVTLRGLDLPFILWGMAAGTDSVQRNKIKLYLTKLRRVGIVVKGRDLMAKGAPAGPRLKEALEKTLLAKMDGYVETREEEMAFALRSFNLKI
jgi:tRNA nucleotidyltransferase (CCA-adding enzyme)